ncbi:DUF1249 domain-containing protein [Algicola sagamiensis]|uniref:DUF1249 domain-containing protein n=1 Tax=Algicola sagamiensis TaxID=163869 RepID=UPI00035D8CB1|nr:DUF1249 domain-containing protein [Algicola sagamiensis]
MVTATKVRKKYVPNLPDFHSVCEHNYMRLIRLLPNDLEVGNSFTFQVSKGMSYQVEVTEIGKYTTTVDITQRELQWPEYLRPHLYVRLYHDARMAEVLKSQRIGQIKPSYTYPNPNMHQPDEKYQTNMLLRDWLTMAMMRGCSTMVV